MRNLEGVEAAAVVEEEVEGALVAVLDQCQWEACLVEECLNFVQWETAPLAEQHCGLRVLVLLCLVLRANKPMMSAPHPLRSRGILVLLYLTFRNRVAAALRNPTAQPLLPLRRSIDVVITLLPATVQALAALMG